MRSDEELLSWLLEQNAALAQMTDEQWLATRDSPSFIRALKKARGKGFFLGLADSWLEGGAVSK